MRRTKEGAEATRGAIQQAALALFSERGVALTTLTDVARKAGVTRGAIYWHFDNKEDLLRSLKAETILPYRQIGMAGERADEPDPMGKLREMLLAMLADAADNTATRQVLQIWLDRGRLGSRDRRENAQDEAHWRREALEGTERILRNAAHRGQLPQAFDVRLGALAILIFIDGAIMTILQAPASSCLKEDILRVTEAFLHRLCDGGNPHLCAPVQG